MHSATALPAYKPQLATTGACAKPARALDVQVMYVYVFSRPPDTICRIRLQALSAIVACMASRYHLARHGAWGMWGALVMVYAVKALRDVKRALSHRARRLDCRALNMLLRLDAARRVAKVRAYITAFCNLSRWGES